MTLLFITLVWYLIISLSSSGHVIVLTLKIMILPAGAISLLSVYFWARHFGSKLENAYIVSILLEEVDSSDEEESMDKVDSEDKIEIESDDIFKFNQNDKEEKGKLI